MTIKIELKTSMVFNGKTEKQVKNFTEKFTKKYKEHIFDKYLSDEISKNYDDINHDVFVSDVKIIFEENNKKCDFEEYKKSLWEKREKMDFQSLMMWYEKYLKLEYEKEKYNNFIKELQS